jgi:hypothetical protein
VGFCKEPTPFCCILLIDEVIILPFDSIHLMKRALTVVASVVALLAISLGLIGRFQPTLFFLIPNFGFVLYLITGHSLPPYFSGEAWETNEMNSWVKDGDVIVATG